MLNTKTTVELVTSNVGASYPYFGMHNDGTIVLFISKKTGVCMSVNKNKTGKVGEYRVDWIEDFFEPIEVQEIVFKITDNS